MATVINNPSSDSGSSGAGWGVAVVIAILVILALLFGIPALRGATGGGASVTVPESIDVNVGGGGAGGQ
ncbi:MAG TPA: hypothetical protein VNU47_02465 [Candidatus Paceibacterota bacterium]|nr:hypothetical protein [Candidatus Paceibacterota bacterium]